MAGESTHTIITDDDHSAILAIVTWCLGCALIFGAAIRIGTRLLTKHGPNLDDMCIILAVAFAIGGIIVVSFAVQSGLGMRRSSLSEDRLSDIEKETYIVTILYVMTVGVSKLSVAAFLDRLACTRPHRFCVILLSVILLGWTASITTVVVFACGSPQPWGSGKNKCIDELPFWISASVVDISTDIAMILLPIHIVSGLDINKQKKLIVMTIFALRILPICLSFIRVILLHASLSHASDPSFDSIPFHSVTQAHAVLSILLACGPSFKPFIHNIRASISSSRLAKHRTRSTFGHDSYILGYFGKAPQDNDNMRITGGSSLDGRLASCKNRSQFIASWFRTSTNAHYGSDPTTGRDPHPTPRANNGSVSTTRNTKESPPRRPPPPPEELRPDLSIFGPRLLVVGYTDAGVNSAKPQEDEDSAISEGRDIGTEAREV